MCENCVKTKSYGWAFCVCGEDHKQRFTDPEGKALVCHKCNQFRKPTVKEIPCVILEDIHKFDKPICCPCCGLIEYWLYAWTVFMIVTDIYP